MPEAMNDTPSLPAERIAKRIARSGLCSRRDAERWIEAGRVAVGGTVLTTPATTVTAADLITVDGRPLPDAEPTRLFRFHKPPGVLTAARDPEGRRTLADLLPAELPRLMPIGRLDLNSEGLLLLTNDGGLKRQLELPSTGWLRRYRVRVHGQIDEAQLAGLKKGIRVDGFDYGPIEAVLDRVQGSNAWLTVALREGKNREIRRVMEHFGWQVNRLIRLSYGPFQLGGLTPGALDEVQPKVLREQLGSLLGEAAARPRRTRRAAVAAQTPAASAGRVSDSARLSADAPAAAGGSRPPARNASAQIQRLGSVGGKTGQRAGPLAARPLRGFRRRPTAERAGGRGEGRAAELAETRPERELARHHRPSDAKPRR
jgi:23S rRNA pseudouridine2605 synthase